MGKTASTYKCDNCHQVSSRGGISLFEDCVLCAKCHLKWRSKGKPRCPACKMPMLDLKRHLLMNKDDKHLVLEVIDS